MSDFTNPLDNIRIASPCPADWNEMIGDERKRFCSQCSLNVYNLSGMTKAEGENLLLNSEGRLCITFYRRTDGTILTQNCPVGWAKVKQRVSRIATATLSLLMGFSGGILSFNFLKSINLIKVDATGEPAIEIEESSQFSRQKAGPSFGGIVSNSGDVVKMILRNRR